MIKVLFLIPTLGHGGAERVLVNLVNHMDRGRFLVTVQTLFDEGVNKQYLQPDIKYKSFWKHQFHGNSRLFARIPAKLLYKMVIHEPYDIIVSYLEGPTAHLLAGCPDLRTKRVAWVHIELNDPKLFSVGFWSFSAALKAYSEFDQIVCVANTVMQVFERTAGKHFNRIKVLYNTNETAMIQERAAERISDIAFSEEEIKVCAVAKLMHVKGFDRLVRVHKRLLEEQVKHHIYILGVGEKKEELENYIAKNHLQNSFTLLGYRDNPYKYVAAADIYICSSRREGFSTAVTESLIVGTPVVSTCCSGAYELLGEPDPCLQRPVEDSAYELCEFGIVTENSEQGIYEGLKKMLTDAELRRHYAQQAKLRGQRFSTEKTVRAVEEMLLELYEER